MKKYNLSFRNGIGAAQLNRYHLVLKPDIWCGIYNKHNSGTGCPQVVVVSEPLEDGRPKRFGEQTLTRLPSIRRASEMPTSKERRYIFDKAFDGSVDTQTLYNQSVRVSLDSFNLELQ